MSKKLRITWLNCTVCDSNKIEVTTELGNDEWLYDGDKAKCLNCCATGEIETDGVDAWFEADEEQQNVQLH
ncbi:hypothetical protein [Photobacterium alginatilyticum]|uniref:CPXCG motif-containing cysteine-rich protein n=1 Tax=Photobacterium alginatilyticum TaxID=1775171 RepID=A0ABW9YLJ7_9GAMM|nr:hypothetical protein [Photobacterium alginatilyticum]NBI54684.1 hypothetical protein [Photobacterium alginatilyticum]